MKKKNDNNLNFSPVPSKKEDTESTAKDFEFVQLGSSIHEQKFKTKPTTYFKDAFKRFIKSKSAVVAACMLAALMIMAAVVPFADPNDIETPVNTSSYLPPKWFDDANGFMDGTGYVSDVLIDPSTMEPASETKYNKRSIKGDITYTNTYANILTETVKEYGKGGDMVLRLDKVGVSAGMLSPTFTYDTRDISSFLFTFDEEACSAEIANSPIYEIEAYCYFSGTSETPTIITASSAPASSYSTFSLGDLSTTIESSEAYKEYYASEGSTSFPLAINIKLDAIDTTDYPALYIKSISASSIMGLDYSSCAFSDATEMMSRTSTYTITGSGALDIYHSIIITGAFRYDYYDAAFGDDTFEFSENEIDKFISNGWMTYSWTDSSTSGTYSPNDFALTELGETYCPIRSVSSENISGFGSLVSHSLTGVRSLYRYDYYKGYIGSCSPNQKYIFGTTQNGNDFFKIVFSGLFTSLLLGVMTAVITISFGLIWGAISGYFGGWTDILMERFVEILGGMPWIVMMTLIVLLLGSNFWTFLLALCLTGWIGVAEQTREQFYRFKGREYVLASRTLGASDFRLIFRHILPNGIGTIVTSIALIIPSVIFSEATISYLLPGTLAFSGSQSFGVTLSNAQSDIHLYPYMIVSASIIMAILMICFNLFGNGLRDAFNPSLKGSDD